MKFPESCYLFIPSVHQREQADVTQRTEQCCERWETAGVGVGFGKRKRKHAVVENEISCVQRLKFSKE